MNITFIAGFAEELRKFLNSWFGVLLSIIPKTLYAMCTFIFSIMDILQMLVRKAAGLDVVYYTGENWSKTGAQEGDIVTKFLETIFSGETSILTTIFWAMIILGAILLFLTTLIAILRSEYATLDEKSSSKGKIVGQALKAIASFAVVPIVAFFGMYLANIILQAIDSATASPTASAPLEAGEEGLFASSTTKNGVETYINYNIYGHVIPTTSTPISGKIFTACTYKANRIRYYTPFRAEIVRANESVGAGVFNRLSSNPDAAASLLDDCFANSYALKADGGFTLSTEPFKSDYLYPIGGSTAFFSNSPVNFKSFDKNNVALVWYYYDLWSFDFIICIAALLIAAKLLIDLAFGLVKRIFELIILFLIAPPIAALMPLDNGAGLKNWRSKFIAKAIGTYAPIAGLNLLFSILPQLSTIKFFNIIIVDKIIEVLFLLVGLLMIKDLVALISELTGGEDTLKSGEGMSGQVGGLIGNVAKAAVMPASLAVGGAKFLGKAGKAVAGKAQLARNRKAEKGAILGNIADGNYSDSDGNKITSEDFGNLGWTQQKRFLKSARLGMSDEDRTSAHGAGSANRASFNTFRRLVPFARYKMDEGKSAETLGKEALTESQNQRLLQGAAYQSLTNPVANKTRAIESDKEESDKFAKASYRKRKSMIKDKITYNMSKEDKEEILNPKTDEQKYLRDRSLEGQASWEKENASHLSKTMKGKVSARSQKYANFNQRFFGAEGSTQRIESDSRKARQSSSEKAVGREFARAGGEFLSKLSSVAKSMGGEFAKGWKEAGGWSSVLNSLKGVSDKTAGFNKDVKDQRKALAAQREAEKIMGISKGSSAPSKIDISNESVNLLAESIAKKLGK